MISKLLPAAIFWRLIVFLYYAFWALPYYGEGGDVWNYHNEGIRIAQLLQQGEWGSINWGISTTAMNLLFGFMYAPFGADIYGFALFSSIVGLGGALYMCRAFELWAPPAKTRVYSAIVLFLPSYAFWASTPGKDSWIGLGLGLSAYGYSAMYRSSSWKGIWHLGFGLLITAIIRPHIGLVETTAMAVAYLWGLTQKSRGSAPMKVLRIAALVGLVGFLYPLTLKLTGLSEDVSAEGVEQYMQANSDANAKAGGSVVEVQVAPGIGGVIRALPRGVVRVLLEPFPWQIRNVNSALAALENLFIAGLLIRYARHVRGMLREVIRNSYFLFSGFLAFGLILLFMFVPNLGLLSRQRVQMLPFLLALFVAAETTRRKPVVAILPMQGSTAQASNAQIS